MMKYKRATLVAGAIYRNKNGSEYLCKELLEGGDATMERVTDGWTLTAVGVCEYENGEIEWDYSKHGHFAR